jgi:hypothetical protein
MHVVGRQMTFQNPAFPLLRQVPKDLAQMLTKIFIQHLAAALGDKHNVILAIPFRVA